jgi:Ca2+-binding EF-hand superfamily protein
MFRKYSSGVGVSLGFGSGYYFSTLDIYKEKLEPVVFNTVENRFKQFADITKGEVQYMSPASFIKSILLPKPKLPSWVAFPRKNGKLLVDKSLEQDAKLQKLLSMADSNSDGLISFQEYQFFLKLLTCQFSDFKLAFQVFFTQNSKNKVFDDKITSKNICKILKCDPEFAHFFGKEVLNFEDFHQSTKALKDEVIRQEFKNYDVEGSGLISVESFSELITSSVHFNGISKIPKFKKKLNLLKTNGHLKPSGRINFETFTAFHVMSETSDEIGKALKLYAEGGRPVHKQDFKRAVTVTTGFNLKPKTVDLIYALFDENNDGNLEYKEFVGVLKSRRNIKDLIL